MTRGLAWPEIVRLGLVQSAIGAMTMLATSLLNRVMVVEYALPAALPAGLVAWHYAVQLSRPIWGHGSDAGRRRTPWIIGGMALLGAGVLGAVGTLPLFATHSVAALPLAIVAFAAIGAGVGASGTSLLALLASRVAPERRAAAAAVTWIMMVMGIAATAGIAGALVDPFSLARLARVAAGIVAVAFVITLLALKGVEGDAASADDRLNDADTTPFFTAVAALWQDEAARRFTIFVFVSMIAYSMQDMILEPFAGLRFGLTPGQSTSLSAVQHAGVLTGMIAAGVGGSAFAGGARDLRQWIFAGCIGSGLALAGLAFAAQTGAGWPLRLNVFLLGLSNGVFAVAAIGAMMALAGAGGPRREGLRMGIWGAAQAIAFGCGGLIGAVGVDFIRALVGDVDRAFTIVFASEAMLFLVAAALSVEAARLPRAMRERTT